VARDDARAERAGHFNRAVAAAAVGDHQLAARRQRLARRQRGQRRLGGRQGARYRRFLVQSRDDDGDSHGLRNVKRC